MDKLFEEPCSLYDEEDDDGEEDDEEDDDGEEEEDDEEDDDEDIEEKIQEQLEENEVIERKIDTYFKCRYCNKNINNKDVHWIFFLPYCDKFCYEKFLFEKNK